MDGCKYAFCHIRQRSPTRDAGGQTAGIDDDDDDVTTEHGSLIFEDEIRDEEPISKEETTDTDERIAGNSESGIAEDCSPQQ